MQNRCLKCDNDRFLVDKKGNLITEKAEVANKETGEVSNVDAVKCSWCGNLVPIAA